MNRAYFKPKVSAAPKHRLQYLCTTSLGSVARLQLSTCQLHTGVCIFQELTRQLYFRSFSSQSLPIYILHTHLENTKRQQHDICMALFHSTSIPTTEAEFCF